MIYIFLKQSGEESGASGRSSSDSNAQMASVTNTSQISNEISHKGCKPASLTEAILNRHTDEMETLMVKNHKKYRIRGTYMTDKMKKAPDNTVSNLNTRNQPLKRSCSNSWEKELNKNSKQHHLIDHRYGDKTTAKNRTARNVLEKKTNDENNTNNNNVIGQNNITHTVDLWPPFSVSVTTVQQNTQSNRMNRFAPPNGLLPALYYLPAVPPLTREKNQSSNSRFDDVSYFSFYHLVCNLKQLSIFNRFIFR